MVLRETQRAFVYFSLHGLTVDRILVNRVLPADIHDPFFAAWRQSQAATLEEIDTYFAPVRGSRVPLFQQEVLGMERLEHLAGILYPNDEDPAIVEREERPYTFEKQDGQSRVVMKLPFTLKGEVGLFKKGDELIVQIGTLRRHIGLPTSMAALSPARAKLEGNILTIDMNEVG